MKRLWEELRYTARLIGRSPAVVFAALFTLGLAIVSATGWSSNPYRSGTELLPSPVIAPADAKAGSLCPKHAPTARSSGVRTLLFHRSPRRERPVQSRLDGERTAVVAEKQGGSASGDSNNCFSIQDLRFPELNIFKPLL
jgi:hypothetical protein